MNPEPILLAITASLDWSIYQGMYNLPTEQKHHTCNKDSALQNHRPRKCTPIHTDSDGSDHRTPLIVGIWCHTNYSRPWMLTRSCLPTLQCHDHRPPNCAIILQTHIPLVWTTCKGNIRQRPSIHKSFWKGPSQGTQNYMEHVNGIPPLNRRADRVQEPMARTIPPIGSSKQ